MQRGGGIIKIIFVSYQPTGGTTRRSLLFLPPELSFRIIEESEETSICLSMYQRFHITISWPSPRGTLGQARMARLGLVSNFKEDAILVTHMRRPHRSEESVEHRFEFEKLNDQIRRASDLSSKDISRY